MSFEAVGRRYARAIFELGKESGSLPQVRRDMADFAAMYEGSEDLRSVLNSPLVADQSREAVVQELCKRMGASELSLNALRLIARRRRIAAVADVARELERLVDEDAGIVRAVVTSAGALSESYLAKLQAEIEKTIGKKVAIVHQQDPTLIAGVITRIGDLVIDGSVRSRLSSFRESLLRT